MIEVEDGGHGEELQSQEATFFQRLELGDTDGNGMVGAAANDELLCENAFCHDLSVLVVGLFQIYLAVGQRLHDAGLAFIEEEERAVSHVDNEITRKVDPLTFDVHTQHGADHWHRPFVKGEVEGGGTVDEFRQMGLAADADFVVGEVQTDNTAVVGSMAKHVDGQQELVVAISNLDGTIEEGIADAKTGVTSELDVVHPMKIAYSLCTRRQLHLQRVLVRFIERLTHHQSRRWR